MAEGEQPAAGKPEYQLALPGDKDRASWIEHLGSLYSLESTLVNVAVTIAAAATPILIGFVLELPLHCERGADTIVGENGETERCLQDVHFLALPIMPILVLLVYSYVFFNGRVVGKYLRALERSLTAGNPGALRDGRRSRKLRFPALGRLNGALYGAETNSLAPLRFLYLGLAATIFTVSTGSIVFVLWQVRDEAQRIAGVAFYSLLLLLIVVSFSRGASHATFDKLIEAVARRDLAKQKPYAPVLSWPLFLRFALAPRILSIFKGQDAVVVAALVVVLGYWSGGAWPTALGLVLAYELILYQTRYLLNGLREDPGVLPLPGNIRNDEARPMTPFQQLAGLLVAALRVLAFVVVARQLGMSGEAITWFTGALGAVFLAYEIPRERWREKLRAIATDADPADVGARVATELGRRSTRAAGWFLFVVVGSGYGLRVAFALYVTAPDMLWSPFGAGLIAAVWAVASAQVAAGWMVELQGARHADSPALHAGILAKPHLYWVATRLRGNRPAGVRVFDLEESRWREKVTSWDTRALVAPWEAASVVSVCALLLAIVVNYPSWVRAGCAALVAVAMLVRAWYLSHHEASRYPSLLGWPAVAGTGVAMFLLVIDQGWRPATAYGVVAAWLVLRLMASRDGRFDRLVDAARNIWTRARGVARTLGGVLLRIAEYLLGHTIVRAFADAGKKRRNQWLGW
ncbi:hypothetical protein GCM10027059_44170 [Myceligenerans halotolerans]